VCIIRAVTVIIVRELRHPLGRFHKGGEYVLTLLIHEDNACCPSPT
jgi:hypothetical protein